MLNCAIANLTTVYQSFNLVGYPDMRSFIEYNLNQVDKQFFHDLCGAHEAKTYQGVPLNKNIRINKKTSVIKIEACSICFSQTTSMIDKQ